MTEDELESRFRELRSRIDKVESQHNELNRRTISKPSVIEESRISKSACSCIQGRRTRCP
jgi:hypothetical protein